MRKSKLALSAIEQALKDRAWGELVEHIEFAHLKIFSPTHLQNDELPAYISTDLFYFICFDENMNVRGKIALDEIKTRMNNTRQNEPDA